MKMLVAKMTLATSVAIATLIAAEAAFAQPQRQQAASEAYDDQANPNYGFDPRVTMDEWTGMPLLVFRRAENSRHMLVV